MKLYWLSLISFGLFTNPLLADDTEIYLGNPNRVNPNVIFIFDTSGSMGTYAGSETRLDIVKRAAKDTIDDISGINLALMRYNPSRSYYESGQDKQYRGGYLSTPMLDIDAGSNKEDFKDIIDAYNDGGGTPMTESVHEALSYLRGDPVNYGRTKRYSSYPWTYLSHSSTHSNGRYISPITDQCQKNHIVLFTDGDSSVDGESNAAIRDMLRTTPYADRPRDLSTNCSSNGGGNTTITNSCIEELAYYMYTTDNSPLDGDQHVQFHAIGGFLSGNSQSFLNSAATHGGGISAEANDYQSLKNALTKIFDDISKSADTFSAPAVAVNAFNSLELLDQLYFSVFKPHASVSWQGNVKRFRLKDGGTFVDANDSPAIDPNTGFFRNNARSFWTLNDDAPDGDNVEKGGIASRLTTDRRVVSNLINNNLMDSGNRITESNSNVKQTLFNTSYSSSEFKKLVQWTRGLDTKGSDPTAARRRIEDPLHSKPILLNYGTIQEDGVNVPDSTLFIGTNSGYLHAFDTKLSNPKERFAFIPKELLPNAAAYYAGGGTKIYGLDGPISSYHTDINRNRIIDPALGEKAYIYVAMRRGGRNYYALDVTDRDNPKLAWQITGGTGDFKQLGQSWSKISVIPVLWNNKKRDVLLFAGGYDPDEDNNKTRKLHAQGNAIYLVDPETGKRLWWASADSSADLQLNKMTSGIVGQVIPVDNRGDGNVDLLYAADLGGRIWRIDLTDLGSGSANSAQGGMIADLGADNTTLNHVRFYNNLDVIYTKRKIQTSTDPVSGNPVYQEIARYQLAIGSGYRAHPLDTDTRDSFYVVNDMNVDVTPPTSYTTVTKSDLANLNNYSAEPANKKINGYYIPLTRTGEKVLSTSTTVNGRTFFSTFRPNLGSSSGCNADAGNGQLYSVQISANNADATQPKDPHIDDWGKIDNPLNDLKLIITGNGSTTGGGDDDNPPPPPPPPFPPKDCGEIITDGSSTISICEDGAKIIHKSYWRELF